MGWQEWRGSCVLKYDATSCGKIWIRTWLALAFVDANRDNDGRGWQRGE